MKMLLKKMLSKVMGAAVVSACVGLAAPGAQASHIPGTGFTAGPFTVNPSAVGEGGGTVVPFSASFINFNYQGEADQVGNGCPTGPASCAGVFVETGIFHYTAFSTTLTGAAILSSITGLNNTYQMYLTFDGRGTLVNNLAGGIDGTFTSFAFHIFVDKAGDTTFTHFDFPGPGSVGLTPGPGAPDFNGSRSVTGLSGDDVNVLNGTLFVGEGGFHVNTGITGGDFDVQVVVSDCGTAAGFFCGPGGLKVGTIGDLNGVNTRITTDHPLLLGAGDTATDIIIDGSGNTSFVTAVPEPGSLGLSGLGVLLLGLMGLRRRKSV